MALSKALAGFHRALQGFTGVLVRGFTPKPTSFGLGVSLKP